MKLTIDGKECTGQSGETLLEVARRNGVDIPTLCYHDALESRGACRMCMVEISNPKHPGWKKLVASCVYPVEDGLEVKTATDEIKNVRKTLLDLLLARTPDAPVIKRMAKEYGLAETSYKKKDPADDCILCGMCVRVCEDVIGANAIGMSGRGVYKKAGPALGKASSECIGCGACAHVCPTQCIDVIDDGMTRRIPRWADVQFELVPCRICGKPVSTRQHIDFVRNKLDVGPEVLETCPDCLRKYYGGKVAVEGHM